MINEYDLFAAEMRLDPQAQEGQEIAYYAPTTLEEADNLKQQRSGFHFLGGGTILNWKGAPRVKGLIDLRHLSLGEIEVTPSFIKMGATATIQELAEHPDLPPPVIAAAKRFSSRNIRNMATIGGTAAGKFFVSDLLPVLLAFQADIEYIQHTEKRSIPLSQWLQEQCGMICSVIIHRLQRHVAFRQEKISSMDFPLIVTSIGWQIAGNRIQEPIVAISGASGKILMSESGAAHLSGKELSAIDFETLNAAVQQDVQPIGTIKATPRVKRKIIEHQVKEIVSELQQGGQI